MITKKSQDPMSESSNDCENNAIVEQEFERRLFEKNLCTLNHIQLTNSLEVVISLGRCPQLLRCSLSILVMNILSNTYLLSEGETTKLNKANIGKWLHSFHQCILIQNLTPIFPSNANKKQNIFSQINHPINIWLGVIVFFKGASSNKYILKSGEANIIL